MKSPPLSARTTVISPKKSSIKMTRISLKTEPAHQKYNFSELTNLTTIIKDTEMKERRNTCNTFLKNKELQEFVQNSFVKNSALYEIKRDLTFDQLAALQTLSSVDWKKKPMDKKGIMYINELWSDRHYKVVVNSSDLKPKTDLLKIQKKIKLFSDMLKDVDIAYKKIKKFNPKEQMDIINTYFNEGSSLFLRPSTSINRKSSNNIFAGRINRSQMHGSALNLKTLQSSIQNMNLNFPQNLLNYEKNIVSYSLDDLLQKLDIFAKLESAEKSQELKSMFKKVMNEKMENVDISNEKELVNSRNFRNTMMSHYNLNKHSRGKHSSIVASALQTVHTSPRKKGSTENETKNKFSLENIISDNNNYTINMNTFDHKNVCKPIGFKRDLSKRTTTKSDDQRDSLKKLETLEVDDDKEEEEFNIYQSPNIQKTLLSESELKMHKNQPKRMSNFGRKFSSFGPTTIKIKPQSVKEKIKNNTNALINKCENLKDQNYELFKQINIGLKLKEINQTKEFKQNINREDKILKDINKFIQDAHKKLKPDLSKKEKEKTAIKKLIQAYYVGYESDDQESDY